jgi:hypothetical protein
MVINMHQGPPMTQNTRQSVARTSTRTSATTVNTNIFHQSMEVPPPQAQAAAIRLSQRTSSTPEYTHRQLNSVDFTQQPHPEYSYYRGTSSARRISSATNALLNQTAVTPPSSHKKALSSGTEQTLEPTRSSGRRERSLPPLDRRATSFGQDPEPLVVSEGVRDSVFAKRESIYALPPMPEARASVPAQALVKPSKSTKSIKPSKSTGSKPRKIKRKSTLRNVVSNEEL